MKAQPLKEDDMRHFFNMTPDDYLLEAAWSGHAEIAKAALKSGANKYALGESGAAIHYAARRNNAAVVQLLLDEGVDPNLPDRNNEGPLAHTMIPCATEAAKVLLARGANPNMQRRDDKRTPLHILAQYGGTGHHFELAQLLLDNGADKTIQDKTGGEPSTALALAHRRHNYGIESVLLGEREKARAARGIAEPRATHGEDAVAGKGGPATPNL
jgi:uncharacterized protein